MIHLKRNLSIHIAATIKNQPTISFIDETSPKSTKAHTAANTDSIQRMIFDSLAEVSFCPCCCNRSATAPGPTALYANSNHTTGEFHPDQRGVGASTHPVERKDVPADANVEAAVVRNHAPYINARSAVLVNWRFTSE